MVLVFPVLSPQILPLTRRDLVTCHSEVLPFGASLLPTRSVLLWFRGLGLSMSHARHSLTTCRSPSLLSQTKRLLVPSVPFKSQLRGHFFSGTSPDILGRV